MWTFLRRRLLWFLIGFVAVFVVYLFVRFNVDAVILGIVVSAFGGVATSLLIFFLERRFPEETAPVTGDRR